MKMFPPRSAVYDECRGLCSVLRTLCNLSRSQSHSTSYTPGSTCTVLALELYSLHPSFLSYVLQPSSGCTPVKEGTDPYHLHLWPRLGRGALRAPRLATDCNKFCAEECRRIRSYQWTTICLNYICFKPSGSALIFGERVPPSFCFHDLDGMKL